MVRLRPGLASAVRLWAAAVALWCGMLAPGAAPPENPDARIGPLVAACRDAGRDAAPNPSDPGGWSLGRSGGTDVLCLTGTLEAVRVGDVLAGLRRTRGSLAVVVRSAGGPVDVWLGLAESLVGGVDVIVVDDACMSSCANYMVPLAETVLATPGSLVVWHGGPVGSATDLQGTGITDIGALVAYDGLARRTASLYRRLGLDVAVLAVSGEPPDAGKLRRIVRAAGAGPVAAVTIGGYALSPARLARCFGFRNVAAMWHAGDDDAVARLAARRMPGTIVLESPGGPRTGGESAPADC